MSKTNFIETKVNKKQISVLLEHGYTKLGFLPKIPKPKIPEVQNTQGQNTQDWNNNTN